jgi:hypothetical protein
VLVESRDVEVPVDFALSVDTVSFEVPHCFFFQVRGWKRKDGRREALHEADDPDG